MAKITADNGYSLFVNGDLVGSGGAILPTTDPNYEANGWVRTDTYQFIAPCEMPTSCARSPLPPNPQLNPSHCRLMPPLHFCRLLSRA